MLVGTLQRFLPFSVCLRTKRNRACHVNWFEPALVQVVAIYCGDEQFRDSRQHNVLLIRNRNLGVQK
jgi:hypothetical protein